MNNYQYYDVNRAGWIQTDFGHHMGTTSTTYKYESAALMNQYSNYIEDGIDVWGGYIDCQYSATSTAGIIKFDPTLGDYAGFGGHDTMDYQGHVITWSIVLSESYFSNENISDNIKICTVAHEIGHVYGLGDVSFSSSIMYHTVSAYPIPVTGDYIGMEVMTHEHSHTTPFTRLLEPLNTMQHKAVCRYCWSYKPENCSYRSVHSGNTHYYYFNCECGNSRTQSWPCTGNPCVMPFSIDHDHEIE